MALSWNEIKDRALSFSKEWIDTAKEEADAKPFLVEFFNVFGISSKRVGTFEHRVKKLDEKDGYIDLLWKGMILIEMKSRGKNLDKAYTQAKDYLHGLEQHELPKYILISDFDYFRLYDLEEDKIVEFRLNELVSNVQHFGYLLGYQKKIYKEQDPANIKAAELMGKLHDRLKEIGYIGHRWKIEQFHREAKQTTGLEHYQCRLNRSQRNHIAAAMLVWLSVKELADKTKKTVYQLKQGLLSDYLIQQMRNPTIAFS